MKSNEEQRKERTENEITPFDDVVTMRGINNPGLHNETFPPSVQNNNGRLSGIYRIH